MLARMFDPDSAFGAHCVDEEGHVFIDRDGKFFHYVLDYLRTFAFIVPMQIQGDKTEHNRELLVRLLLEAEYFGLQQMAIAIQNNIRQGSIGFYHQLGFTTVTDLRRLGFIATDFEFSKGFRFDRKEFFESLTPVALSAEEHCNMRVMWIGGPKIRYMDIGYYRAAVCPDRAADGQVQIKFCGRDGSFGEDTKGEQSHAISKFEGVRLMQFS